MRSQEAAGHAVSSLPETPACSLPIRPKHAVMQHRIAYYGDLVLRLLWCNCHKSFYNSCSNRIRKMSKLYALTALLALRAETVQMHLAYC